MPVGRRTSRAATPPGFASLPDDLPPGRLVLADAGDGHRPRSTARRLPDNVWQGAHDTFDEYAHALVGTHAWSFWWG
ncbi:DUF4253 domain-containing protein [Cellulosimicrobium sp. 22601]|uniref:DUF4253 domain-containing protein n=1 Tax=unclassified Cellulosimicrobium TaxID=2624466 RepID=UPI003F878007